MATRGWREERTFAATDTLGQPVTVTTGVIRDDRGIPVPVLAIDDSAPVVLSEDAERKIVAAMRGAIGDAAHLRRGGGIR